MCMHTCGELWSFGCIQDERFGRVTSFELPLTRRLLVLWAVALVFTSSAFTVHAVKLRLRLQAAAEAAETAEAAACAPGMRSSSAREAHAARARWWVPMRRAVTTELLKLLEASAAWVRTCTRTCTTHDMHMHMHMHMHVHYTCHAHAHIHILHARLR